MKKLLALCGAALIALLAVAGLAPAAQAYPDVHIDLTVNRQVLYGSETFTATGTSDVTCAWNLTWNGVVRTGTGTTGSPFRTTYTAPAVTKITKIPLHGTCAYTQPTARKAAKLARTAASAATWERTIMITVLPRGSAVSPPENSGQLPNTGGPDVLIFVAGLGLLAMGSSAVMMARRRAESADTIAGRT